MKTVDRLLELMGDFGEWIVSKSRKKSNAVILVILSLISPLAFIFVSSIIVHFYRQGKKSRRN